MSNRRWEVSREGNLTLDLMYMSPEYKSAEKVSEQETVREAQKYGLEISIWDKENKYRYTIACFEWRKSKDCFVLESVGPRLADVSAEDYLKLKILCEKAYRMLYSSEYLFKEYFDENSSIVYNDQSKTIDVVDAKEKHQPIGYFVLDAKEDVFDLVFIDDCLANMSKKHWLQLGKAIHEGTYATETQTVHNKEGNEAFRAFVGKWNHFLNLEATLVKVDVSQTVFNRFLDREANFDDDTLSDLLSDLKSYLRKAMEDLDEVR